MRDLAAEVLAGDEAWVVGGAVRDELLGRPLVDLDIACRQPQQAARQYARRSGGAPFPLSERWGAWRVALDDGRTVDFTPLRNGIEADLATRDFTVNAIAVPLAGGEPVDPHDGLVDLERRVLRAVVETVFDDDPLRLLRAVRLEGELGFRLDPATEALVRERAPLVGRPAGERILAELERLSADGYRRLDELGLLEPLGGSLDLLERADTTETRLVAVFGDELRRFPVSNEVRRLASALLRAEPPPDDSPRAIHRFRRATEPWSVEALRLVGAPELVSAVERARAEEPTEPLLRGDELGLPPGPEIGRLLALVEEERAAGAIATREEALDLVRREGATRRLAQDVRKRGESGPVDALRNRFGATAERQAELAHARARQLADSVRRFVAPKGDERVLDAGTGAGALALALAPLVREVVGVDAVPELLEHARRRAQETGVTNVEFVEADLIHLPFENGSFDLVGCARVLHHVPHPEYAVSELARVLRVGGHVLVLDQIAPVDPLVAIELDRFERARDPTHSRLLPDGDIRAMFEMNDLILIRCRFEREDRPLDTYLDLAGCEGEARERAAALAPADPYRVDLGWYLAVKRPLRA